MKHLIICGLPASGKGTQGQNLQALGYIVISTGDLLRSEIKKGTALGQEIHELISKGNYINDDLALNLIKQEIRPRMKYLFDGFPRTLIQAERLLKEVIRGQDYAVIYLKINPEEVVKRALGRRVCESCQKIYNLENDFPVSGKCTCGGVLSKRSDDTEEVLKKRLEVYSQTMEPVLDYFRKLGKVEEFDATQNPNTLGFEIKHFAAYGKKN